MKTCPFCAEEIQDAAIKCRHCGSMLVDPTAPAAAGAPGPGSGREAQPPSASAPPTTLFRGGPSWKGQFWSVMGALVLSLGGLVAAPVVHLQLDEPWNTALIAAGVPLALGLLWQLYLWAVRATLRFHITARGVDVESGLLSRAIQTLQLWKVRDIEFRQTLTDRVLGVARILVVTHDVTTPELLLWGLPDSRPVFERLKDAIEIARQSRNVIGVVD